MYKVFIKSIVMIIINLFGLSKKGGNIMSKKLFCTKNNILLSTSSSSDLMEVSIHCSTIKRATLLSCGSFENRWHEMGMVNGVPADLFKVELGRAIEQEMIDKVLSANKNDIIMATHNETSIEITNPFIKNWKSN